MNGFFARRQVMAIRFWMAGSFGRGMAFPRSPLAITISSQKGRREGRFSTPYNDSIFAKMRI